MQEGRSYRFTHAVSRKPGQSIANGISSTGIKPDINRFAEQHAIYVETLRRAGLEVHLLDALEAFPDSVFVEDPALCPAGTAIVLRPGAESRFGEADALAPDLERIFGTITRLERGRVDGGDILLTDTEALIGLSERTDREGYEALSPLLEDLGYKPRIVETPEGVLHFKSDCSLLDSETIFATPLLNASGCFPGYRVIETPEGEEAAANLIRVNDVVIMRTGFPRTREALDASGFETVAVDAGEVAKLDGGLSCMSLRFQLN